MSHDQDEQEERDPGLARERTSLAWTRTALSFAAVGGVVLKRDVVAGLVIMAVVPAVWQLGRLAHHLPDRLGPVTLSGRLAPVTLRGRLRLVTATIVAVSLVALAVAVTH